MNSKKEASRPDSSAIYNWFLATENFPIQLKHCSKSLIWPLGNPI